RTALRDAANTPRPPPPCHGRASAYFCRMNPLVLGILLAAFAADPPSADPQRGSAPTPSDAKRMGDSSQQSSRGTPGGDDRTGPPAAGVESGDVNGMAGGRPDQGP